MTRIINNEGYRLLPGEYAIIKETSQARFITVYDGEPILLQGWMPKSQTPIDEMGEIFIPEWLWDKKLKEGDSL